MFYFKFALSWLSCSHVLEPSAQQNYSFCTVQFMATAAFAEGTTSHQSVADLMATSSLVEPVHC